MKNLLTALLLLLSTSALAQQPQTDLQLVKEGGTQGAAGGDVTYTVTVTNLSGTAAAPVTITDTIPPGMVFQQARSPNDFGCSGGTNTVICSGPTLAAGSTATFQFVFNIPAGTPLGTTFTNSATVDTDTPDSNPGNDTDTAQTTVVAPTDLAVVKDGPSEAAAGSDVTYTVTVRNGSGAVATAVEVTDEIPEGMTFVSATPAPGFSCSAVESVVCTAPSLAPGATATFTFVFNIDPETTPGTTFTNAATARTETPDVNPENNTGTTSTTVPGSAADVAVTKSGPAAAGPDTDVVYTIVVRNGGTVAATNVTLTDTLPGTMTFVSLDQSGAPFSCSTPAATTGGTITCTAATLAAGATTTFTLTAHVPAGTSGMEFTNQAVVTSSADPNEENNAGSTTFIVSAVDVSVVKSGPALATAGTNVSYTLTVANSGEPANDVVLTDVIPAGTTLVSITYVSGVAGTCTGGASFVSCTFPVLNAGQSSQYTLVLRAGDVTSISNTANVTTSSFDVDPSDNSSTANTTVTPSADLAVTKSGPASATAGTNVTYSVTLTNNGPSTATNVTLTDTLPAGTTFVSATQTGGPAFTCGHAAGVVTCTRATLAPLASATFQIVAAVAPEATGTITNTAAVNATTADPAAGNNVATAPTTLGVSADLAVTKSGPAAATAGTNVTYTVTVTNNGPSTATNVTLTDTLPAGTTFVSTTQTGGPAFTCGHAGGVVTCTRATLVPLAPATFQIVAAIAPETTGTITNTATVNATTADPAAGNNVATAPTTLGLSADLAVTKSGPAAATAGTNVTYVVTLTNNGPSAATNVTLTDTLPPGTTLVSATQTSGPAFTCSGTVTCTRATLAPLATATFEITVTIPLTATGTMTNTAEVSAATPDPAPANNRSTVVTGIGVAPADVTITKTANAPELFAGATAIFTITVRNAGPGSAENVVVTDVLPAGSTLQSAPGCTGTTTVTCNAGTLAAGASVTYTLTVRLPSTPGPVVNTATVTSTTPDPTPNNNAGTATINAVAVPAGIPTLSTWAIVLLAVALAGIVLLRR